MSLPARKKLKTNEGEAIQSDPDYESIGGNPKRKHSILHNFWKQTMVVTELFMLQVKALQSHWIYWIWTVIVYYTYSI